MDYNFSYKGKGPLDFHTISNEDPCYFQSKDIFSEIYRLHGIYTAFMEYIFSCKIYRLYGIYSNYQFSAYTLKPQLYIGGIFIFLWPTPNIYISHNFYSTIYWTSHIHTLIFVVIELNGVQFGLK